MNARSALRLLAFAVAALLFGAAAAAIADAFGGGRLAITVGVLVAGVALMLLREHVDNSGTR